MDWSAGKEAWAVGDSVEHHSHGYLRLAHFPTHRPLSEPRCQGTWAFPREGGCGRPLQPCAAQGGGVQKMGVRVRGARACLGLAGRSTEKADDRGIFVNPPTHARAHPFASSRSPFFCPSSASAPCAMYQSTWPLDRCCRGREAAREPYRTAAKP